MKSLIKTNRRRAIAATAILSIVTLVSLSPSAKAQAPGIVGIDHVGINVPNLEQAVRFFHDMFGFEPVTKLGPFAMDAGWKKNFRIHEKSGDVTLVMLRAGDGSNIELFEYKPNAGSAEQPYRDDISATHIALYTNDIKSTKAYLEAKGLKFLTDINPGGGDTEGESWVYFETPWGATIELNSYPNGKGYEKSKPALRLWNPSSAVELSTDALTPAALQAFAVKQVNVWNETDTQVRLPKLQEIYRDDISFYDHDGVVNGLAQLNNRINGLQNKNSGFKFSLVKIDNSNNVVRYFWNYGPASNRKLISGMDLIILENGKVRSLHVFIDNLPADK